MKTIYKQEENTMSEDRINVRISGSSGNFYTTKSINGYKEPPIMDFICIDNKDAADFCIEILQELFKDAEFKRETLARWGVKPEQPEQPEQPEWVEVDDITKDWEFAKCIVDNGVGNFTRDKIYKVLTTQQLDSAYLFIADDNGNMFWKHCGSFVKVIRK